MKDFIGHKVMQVRTWWATHSQTVLITIIILFSGGSMVLLAYQGHQISETQRAAKAYNQQQLAAVKKVVDQIQGASVTRTNQINTLTQHIDCIATFFAQTDRTQIVLKNLDSCILANTQTGAIGSKSVPKSSTTSPAPKSSPKAADPPAEQPSQPEQPTAPQNCPIDLLGLHLFCS